MSKPQSLGERLAQARRELGVREHRDVTQLDVARAIGATGASVSEWEADKKAPREDALLKLARYFKVSPAYLRYGVVQPGPTTPTPADNAAFLNGELEETRKARARDEAAKAAGGGTTRRSRKP